MISHKFANSQKV